MNEGRIRESEATSAYAGCGGYKERMCGALCCDRNEIISDGQLLMPGLRTLCD